MRLRPLSGQVLIKIDPRESRSLGGIEIPNVTLSADEVQLRSHNPEKPPPEIATVEAIGQWPLLKNGKLDMPPFAVGAKVVVRRGSGIDCHRNIGERLKLVRIRDLLAVLNEA